ncbi:MAG: zinc-dependent peptidase, partial [Myxococcales bacterium]|nr:zinc-dependent peptidase [Myxococcales bacterium]
MLLRWLRDRRRHALLERPFPPAWTRYLERNMGHYAALSEREQATLRELVQVFVAEKHWEGCGGLELTDEIRVTIAGQACLLILGHDHDLYRKVDTILVYPRAVVPRRPTLAQAAAGTPTRGPMPVLGEAHVRGPVILAWDAALRGGRRPRDGHNLVYHEFAHKLDMLSGTSDGTPPLATREELAAWVRVCTDAYRRVVAGGGPEVGERPVLRPYAGVNPAEFFAVATEAFFDVP